MGCSLLTLSVETNENTMCASLTARVNDVNNYTPIFYGIHVRYSPGPHRARTGAPPTINRANRRMQSQIPCTTSGSPTET